MSKGKIIFISLCCGSISGAILLLLAAPQALAVTVPAAVSAGAFVGLSKK
jgi:hypothetical protein